jgi:hypothetical protein
VRQNITRETAQLRRQGFITTDAAQYLLDYVSGTLHQNPRPQQYEFLSSRWQDAQSAQVLVHRVQYDGEEALRGVRVARLRALDGPDGEDSVDPPLQNVPEDTSGAFAGPVVLQCG